jgi:integrase
MENPTPVPIEGASVVSNHNEDLNQTTISRKGKLFGPKRPFRAGDVWKVRQFLKLKHRTRDLALFNLGIDSKLRACDLLGLRVSDIGTGQTIFQQATIVQKKTKASITFEITDATRLTLQVWIDEASLKPSDFIWSSRNRSSRTR